MSFDAKEAERMSKNISALLDEIGGADEIRELDVQTFRCELDEDDEGAKRAIEEIKALALVHQTSSQLLGVFAAALMLQNQGLARAALEGVRALVRAKLAETADGEEG